MFDFLSALSARRRQLGEVRALSEADLADLGMTRAQLEFFVTVPQEIPDRMDRMAAVFGLSHADLQASAADYAAMMRACAGCGSLGPCRAFLSGAEGGPEEARGFCPNADALAARAAV
ncbi:DUF1127 domain-containing protein [Aliigemmobacter aestuarii]|uniref:DUF1127 domain-containing protein n=1 Tax=Aliigemmobacter aestuarii TaxID=1445661 RepID=A0A4S3MTB2_9RHOB|nr:DUF6455 family protein [Gemmobacter aestuarii]THD85105.1 DUF1127 domain-containing protein [Gemmobacter aestuarii]